MPPAVRLLDPVFVAITGGDWDKFASHTVWTYFPFGRLAKGLTRTIENPTMIAENMFGIPLHDAQTRLKESSNRLNFPVFFAKSKSQYPHGDNLGRARDLGDLKHDFEKLEATFETAEATARVLLEPGRDNNRGD